jgi:hypothetical protein
VNQKQAGVLRLELELPREDNCSAPNNWFYGQLRKHMEKDVLVARAGPVGLIKQSSWRAMESPCASSQRTDKSKEA